MMEEAERALANIRDEREFIPSCDSGVVSIYIKDTRFPESKINLVTFYPLKKIAEFPPDYEIEFEKQRGKIKENLLELGYTIQK